MHRERGLADDERCGPGRIGCDQHGEWERHPQRRRTRPDREQQAGADSEPDSSSGKPSERGRSRRSRVRAQHGQGSENHPESVPDVAQIGDRDRGRQCQSSACAVDEPDGAQTRVAKRDAGVFGQPSEAALVAGAECRLAEPARACFEDPVGARQSRGDGCVGSDRKHGHRDRVSMEGELRLGSVALRCRGSAAAAARCSCGGTPGVARLQVDRNPQRRAQRSHAVPAPRRRAAPGRPAPRRADRRAPGRCRWSATCTTRAAQPRWPAPGRTSPARSGAAARH